MKRVVSRAFVCRSVVPLILIGVFTFSVSGAAAAFKNIKVGDQALPVELNDLDGKEHSLTRYREAEAVLLFFWATWSERSLTELADLNKLQKEYGEKGLQILAVNVENQSLEDKDLNRIRSILNEREVSFPVLIDHGLKTYNDWGVIATPSTAIITSDGIVFFDLSSYPSSGFLDMDLAIRKALGLYVEEEKPQKGEPEYVPVQEALLHFGMGKRHAQKGFMTKALPELDKAAMADSKWAEPHIYLGFVHIRMGDNQKAGSSLDRASQLDPERREIIWLRGYLLAAQEKVDEAVALLQGVESAGKAGVKPGAKTPDSPGSESAVDDSSENLILGPDPEAAQTALDLSEVLALIEAGKTAEAARTLQGLLTERLGDAGFVMKKKKMSAMEKMKLMMQQNQEQ